MQAEVFPILEQKTQQLVKPRERGTADATRATPTINPRDWIKQVWKEKKSRFLQVAAIFKRNALAPAA